MWPTMLGSVRPGKGGGVSVEMNYQDTDERGSEKTLADSFR